MECTGLRQPEGILFWIHDFFISGVCDNQNNNSDIISKRYKSKKKKKKKRIDSYNLMDNGQPS